jgi:hypothetical protein
VAHVLLSSSALQLQLDVTGKAGLARAFYLVNKQAVRAASSDAMLESMQAATAAATEA